MANKFVISDTHLYHLKILTFKRKDGSPLRDFRDIHEMHNTIIERWNAKVGPRDKIYHLGDVTFGLQGFELLKALNGKKRLVRGNHDLYPTQLYLDVFEEVYGARQIDRIWLTHIPMWEGSVNEPRVKLNVHGHLHANIIPHPKYFNVSCECVDYTPVAWDELPWK